MTIIDVMSKCVDCGLELSPENKSKHQPSIRCLACFEAFGARITAMFEDTNAQFDRVRGEVT